MEIVLHRPDKSCWEYTAYDNDQSLGSIIFSISKQSAHIGYISLTRFGKDSNEAIGKQLLQSCINFSELKGCHSINGTLVPVPGCEHAILNLITEFDFSIDKRGRIHKQLASE